MGKLNLIIDTNSLSHLASISVELKRQKPNIWLWKYFNVYVCEAVKDEFLKGISKAPVNSKAIGKKLKARGNTLNTRYTIQLESTWLAETYYNKTMGNKDKGERHILCSALESVYYQKIDRCIIVTDDHTAVKYFLKRVRSDFFFGEIWSALDLVAYMFFAFKDVSHQFAKDAIRDIGSACSYPIRNYKKSGELDEQARMALVFDYNNKIDQIKKFKQKIPSN